ncbi:hypothetical protein QR680_008016 [Steinernema hermaphroditum]|uniref:NAD(+) ADP-ribosyltransferase n=1 Tax=Steinernema hermaphroditum TaxID=289476 RepID=A0AA39M730_9BILA|nr:hypothetical protein QR680_008016 [Steinernema hermaphroditum]
MKIIDDIPTDVVKSQVEESSSSFPIPIKQLMAMIFNKDNMECYMRQMHVDLVKLSLGALSSDHVRSGYGILTDIENVIDTFNGESSL